MIIFLLIKKMINGKNHLQLFYKPKAKLYLKEEWVVKNVPKMMDEVRQELYKYEEAPDILELEIEEKFKDKNGNIIEIEVRGERKYNNCYFKVKDVSNGFEIPNLQAVINGNNDTYIRNIDYKTFSVISKINNCSKSSKSYLFLTYEGIIKLLYVSRNNNAKFFRDWATEKLFTIQLGTENQKDELASSLIGVNHNTIKNVFKTNSSKTPCVYLYLIGKAESLLKGNHSWSKDDILCKYGCTDDLPRCAEHDKIFSKEFNVQIELLCFSIIEAQYIFEAEKNITQFFKGNLVEYNKMKELIIINKKDLIQIKQHYKMIQNSYIGRFEEMNNKIILLEKEIIELNNKILLKDKDIEILKSYHQNELQNKEIELQNKEIEILQCKIKFMEK